MSTPAAAPLTSSVHAGGSSAITECVLKRFRVTLSIDWNTDLECRSEDNDLAWLLNPRLSVHLNRQRLVHRDLQLCNKQQFKLLLVDRQPLTHAAS